MADSSTSQSHSEKKQTFHFRASFDTENIQLVANIRKFHQHNIELSIKNLQRKQSYHTQGVTVLVVLVLLSMAVSKHPNGEFISPKTNKEFKVEDYPMFIPFIDGKKLALHRYIFVPVCYSGHWWLWVIDTTKGRFYILNPLHKKAPSDGRKAPLKKKENELEIKATYVKISGQKSSYDCAIYVMKWLELIEPENIKRAKYEWDNWP
ncbi:uncharacterized protein DS421_13g412030 [Arachis hypogaea]|nr:uncharacterized protein DS421_13g412030 [Arachis hypogaea]